MWIVFIVLMMYRNRIVHIILFYRYKRSNVENINKVMEIVTSKGWMHKEAWSIGVTWANVTKTHGWDFYLQTAAESKLHRPIYKANRNWCWISNVKRKPYWSKGSEPARTVSKPGLTVRKVCCVLYGLHKKSSTISYSPALSYLIQISTVSH